MYLPSAAIEMRDAQMYEPMVSADVDLDCHWQIRSQSLKALVLVSEMLLTGLY